MVAGKESSLLHGKRTDATLSYKIVKLFFLPMCKTMAGNKKGGGLKPLTHSDYQNPPGT